MIGELVQYVSEYVVVQEENSHPSVSIQHKKHLTQPKPTVVNGKRERPVPLDESVLWKNYCQLVRFETIVARNLSECLKGTGLKNQEGYVQSVMYNSELMGEVFGGSEQAMREYFYLRQLQKGKPQQNIYRFSEDFCLAMVSPLEKKVGRACKQLVKESPEWQALHAQFNAASGVNSTHLEYFIEKEAGYFAQWCEKLTQEGGVFSIGDYIQARQTSGQYENDPLYWSGQFIQFLTEKYSSNPSEQGMFTVLEYYLNFWQYFQLLLASSANVRQYLAEEVGFYREYEQLMQLGGLRESLLSYRMWRLNNRTSSILHSLKNPFFLETYVCSFVGHLIEQKLLCLTGIDYEPLSFAAHLKDYVKFVEASKEEFSFTRYADYLEFRRVCRGPQQALKKNKDIIFDGKCFAEYINHEFTADGQPSIKKYKKFFEGRAQKQQEDEERFLQAVEGFKTQVKENESEHFYEILFNDYVTQLREGGKQPELETYQTFRANVLEAVDESYLQEQEALFWQSMLGEPARREEGQRVREEMDEVEEEVAELMGEEDKSEGSEEDWDVEALGAPEADI